MRRFFHIFLEEIKFYINGVRNSAIINSSLNNLSKKVKKFHEILKRVCTKIINRYVIYTSQIIWNLFKVFSQNFTFYIEKNINESAIAYIKFT